MRSLDEMNAKLDTLAENDGKLLAALNELDAKVMATGNGLADEVGQLKAAVGYFAKSALGKRPRPKRKKR